MKEAHVATLRMPSEPETMPKVVTSASHTDASSTEDCSSSLEQFHHKLAPVVLSKAIEVIDLETAKSKEPPKVFSRSAIRRHSSCFVITLCSMSIGYNGTLLNSLLTNNDFRSFFDIEPTGARVGIITAMYQIGAIIALLWLGLLLDRFGRRFAISLGAFFTFVGAAIQSAARICPDPFASLMIGRVFLGIGFAIMTASGPIYIGEIAHPAQRGVVTAIYSTFWLVGSILTSALTGGISSSLGPSFWSWEIPILLQLVFPGLVLLLSWTLPESPRWQFTNSRQDDARKMLVDYHGEGNPDSIWVLLQLKDYDEYLQINGRDNKWWDYRPLFAQRSTRQRLMCACIVAVFGQCSGNGAISNFISGVLTSAGVKNERSQMNTNLGLSGTQLFCATVGSLVVDWFGRRTLLLSSNFGLSAVWTGVIIAAASTNPNEPTPADTAFLVLIYVFSALYAVGYTPVQALYPSEVLPYEMRAKGMAIVSLAQFSASLVNQFAYSILLGAIGWKLFIFFAFWCFLQAAVVYFFIPETKNVTLERMEEIFERRSSVRHSTRRANDETTIA